jgi:hypothetical protein
MFGRKWGRRGGGNGDEGFTLCRGARAVHRIDGGRDLLGFKEFGTKAGRKWIFGGIPEE